MFMIDYSYLLHGPTSARLCFSNCLDIGILKKILQKCKTKRVLLGSFFIIILCRSSPLVCRDRGQELCFPSDWKTMMYVVEHGLNMLKTKVHMTRSAHANSYTLKSEGVIGTTADPSMSTQQCLHPCATDISIIYKLVGLIMEKKKYSPHGGQYTSGK